MNVKKTIVILLVINAIISSYFEVKNFDIPFWVEHARFPSFFEVYQGLTSFFRKLSIVLTFVGVIKLVLLKKIDLINIFKFPIYLFLASNLFWFITCLFSTHNSFFTLSSEFPLFYYIFKIIGFLLLGLIILNYWHSKKESDQDLHLVKVSKWSRLLNWIIDLTIIFSFGFQNIQTLYRGSIIDDISFLNSNPNWFFGLNLLCYYFVLELLFGQTIGKLHNNSTVEYKGKKIKSIFIRTLCRFIPFDAFSFFGENGWHDSVSDTKVVISKK